MADSRRTLLAGLVAGGVLVTGVGSGWLIQQSSEASDGVRVTTTTIVGDTATPSRGAGPGAAARPALPGDTG